MRGTRNILKSSRIGRWIVQLRTLPRNDDSRIALQVGGVCGQVKKH